MGRNVIAVVGATGAQGGGLVDAILAQRSGPFAVRAITRRLDGERARALRARGADVVEADLDEGASLERAFAGAYGAFCVTNFWEHFSPERELAQAQNLAQAAKRAGVRHTVWSTLEDTRARVALSDARMPTLLGRYKVPHFDAKGEADRLFADLTPTTFLRTSFYWENFIHFGMGPKKLGDDTLSLALPLGIAALPGIAARDIGRFAYAIFERGAETLGKYVGAVSEHLTGREMAEALGRGLGRAVTYHDISPDDYRALGFPGCEDLGNMFQYKRDFEQSFRAARDLRAASAIVPERTTFARWVAENASRIPLS